MPIATLIANNALSPMLLEEAGEKLGAAGLKVTDVSWLEVGVAADFTYEGDVAAGRAALAPLMGEADVIVQPAENREKKMLISDMDSTMIKVECIDELADYAGLKDQISDVTERAMRGELDFIEALRGRVALLKGLSEQAIADALNERVVLMEGARILVQTMRARGAHCVLVSGGFTHFTGPVAEMLGFHEAHSNVLGLEGGKLTGEVVGDIVDSSRKAQLLGEIATAHELGAEQVLAVGDGANDIPMIEQAGLGIAYHAKEKARAAADASVSHNDLTALLYAQGIARKDWVLG